MARLSEATLAYGGEDEFGRGSFYVLLSEGQVISTFWSVVSARVYAKRHGYVIVQEKLSEVPSVVP